MDYYKGFYYLIVTYSVINIILSYKNIKSIEVRNIITYNALFMILTTLIVSFAQGVYIDAMNLSGNPLWLVALTSVFIMIIIHFALIFKSDRKKNN